ncbi:leucine-rich repeat extensin-like protein 7 [Iris pallida]|uniref:Leucine-rich repeat extensin-like protein 7 n=1 Tax=Iris pallida TaxID=29817 RepID=A0AAX6G676_IRIPA|nr:leucine-rich repeat extensin-like protein 7 [Iris pallida]KAJ6823835.1 leucine-rich repeat extensin-like protein 7 [Iris pallida]
MTNIAPSIVYIGLQPLRSPPSQDRLRPAATPAHSLIRPILLDKPHVAISTIGIPPPY